MAATVDMGVASQKGTLKEKQVGGEQLSASYDPQIFVHSLEQRKLSLSF